MGERKLITSASKSRGFLRCGSGQRPGRCTSTELLVAGSKRSSCGYSWPRILWQRRNGPCQLRTCKTKSEWRSAGALQGCPQAAEAGGSVQASGRPGQTTRLGACCLTRGAPQQAACCMLEHRKARHAPGAPFLKARGCRTT